MKTRNLLFATGLFAAMTLAACTPAAKADTKITVGVGHMCCPSCKTGAKAALTNVASDVSIAGNDVTMTVKGDNLVVALDALRKGGFPASQLYVGTGPVTIAVAHLCCGKCNAGLQNALTEAKLDGLDTDSMKIGDGNLVVKAKDGMKLDLIPVLAAMEKGGFSASKITVTTSAAAAKKHAIRTASR
jgi:hypothetical protein